MPRKTYIFEKGGPPRIEIAWKGIWKNITISWQEFAEDLNLWVTATVTNITYEMSGNTYTAETQSWRQARGNGKGVANHYKVSATGGLFEEKKQACSYP